MKTQQELTEELSSAHATITRLTEELTRAHGLFDTINTALSQRDAQFSIALARVEAWEKACAYFVLLAWCEGKFFDLDIVQWATKHSIGEHRVGIELLRSAMDAGVRDGEKNMKTRQDHIDFDRNYCEHYKPQPGSVRSDYCALGCDASKRMDAGRAVGQPNMTPCIGGHKADDVLALCPKWRRRSIEHAEARADSIERHFREMDIASPVIAAWRIQPKPSHDRREVIECPVCKGRLHLSQSSYNGHVHARCETKDCISFME